MVLPWQQRKKQRAILRQILSITTGLLHHFTAKNHVRLSLFVTECWSKIIVEWISKCKLMLHVNCFFRKMLWKSVRNKFGAVRFILNTHSEREMVPSICTRNEKEFEYVKLLLQRRYRFVERAH